MRVSTITQYRRISLLTYTNATTMLLNPHDTPDSSTKLERCQITPEVVTGYTGVTACTIPEYNIKVIRWAVTHLGSVKQG